MAKDIISTLNSKDLNEFKKDFSELMRIRSGISMEYSRLGKDVDKYLNQFKNIVDLFNKKYNNLVLRLSQTTEQLQLRIFIKEDNVKNVFVKVASKFNGLKAIGASDFGRAKIEDADRFSKELDKVKNKLFISYFGQEVEDTLFLEQSKDGIIELHYDEGIGNEDSPEFKLCSYYAVKDGIGKIDLYGKLSSIGFVEMPFLSKVRNFFKKFNPRIEE